MPKTLKQKNNKRVNISDNNSNTDIKPVFPPILTTNDLIKNALKSDTPNKTKVKTLPNAFIAYRMALIKEYHSKNLKLPPMGQLSKIAKNSWDKESQNVKNFYNKLVKDAKSLYRQNTIQIVLDNHMNEHMNELFTTTITTNGTSSSIFPTITSSFSSTTSTTNGESGRVICDTDHYVQGTEVLSLEDCIQNSSNGYLPIQDVSFSGSSSTNNSGSQVNNYNFSEYPYEMNLIPNDREYIGWLEQTIHYLLGI